MSLPRSKSNTIFEKIGLPEIAESYEFEFENERCSVRSDVEIIFERKAFANNFMRKKYTSPTSGRHVEEKSVSSKFAWSNARYDWQQSVGSMVGWSVS